MIAVTAAVEMATLDIDSSPCSCLNVDSLTHIDLSKFSQSELRTLSHSSSAAFDLHRLNNIVIPEIDPSIFNESSGSRKQTYSRLRPIPGSPNSSSLAPVHRRRFAGLPTPKIPEIAPDDPEHSENRFIVDSLKRLIGATGNFNSDPDSMALVVVGNTDSFAKKAENCHFGAVNTGTFNSGQRKRKRDVKTTMGLHSEVEEDVSASMEIVNQNGVTVDFGALVNADGCYSEELRRRTLGMESEVELLGFLNNLNGQWGSRRKKRKIVDASEFGDALPINWKILVGLKRKAGRVSLYCRRYLSPNGHHFTSCMEASLYLQSYFGLNDANMSMDHCDGNAQQSSGSYGISNLPGSPTWNGCKEVALLETENLAEVQVRDLFECHKCNMIFDEKDAYLQHLLSSHKKTTRRYRLRRSVGDGVILNDGKFECQFCHKVFNERRSYNGHVGIHVRNHVRSSKDLPGLESDQKRVDRLPMDEKLPKFSKMDALIEIAQSSILEASSPKLPSETDKVNELSYPDSDATYSDDAGDSCHINKPKIEEHYSDGQENGHLLMMGNEMEKNVDIGNVEKSYLETTTVFFPTENDNDFETCDTEDVPEVDASRTDHSEVEGTGLADNSKNLICVPIDSLNEVEKFEGNVGGSSGNELNDGILESMQRYCDEDEAHCLPSTNHSHYKGDVFCGVDELRLDELEPLKYSFLTNDAEMDVDFDTSVQFGSGDVMLNMVAGQEFPAVCVWCRMEFNHQGIGSEIHSDSVGFMCPTCKSQMSAQLNVLDTSFNPHCR